MSSPVVEVVGFDDCFDCDGGQLLQSYDVIVGLFDVVVVVCRLSLFLVVLWRRIRVPVYRATKQEAANTKNMQRSDTIQMIVVLWMKMDDMPVMRTTAR